MEWVVISSSRGSFWPWDLLWLWHWQADALLEPPRKPKLGIQGRKKSYGFCSTRNSFSRRVDAYNLSSSYANMDTSPKKGKQLLVIYGKVAMLNPQQVYFLLFMYFLATVTSWLVSLCDNPWREARNPCQRSHQFIGFSSGFLEDLAWIPNSTEASLVTQPAFSITELANHLCPRVYKPPLQIDWAWPVLVNGL